MSPFCVSKAFVQDTAQSVVALNAPLQKLVGLVTLPIGGAIADVRGRRPVLTLYATSCALACLLFALDSSGLGLRTAWGNAGLYVAGALLSVSAEPTGSVVTGTIADLIGNEEKTKSRAFALVTALNSFLLVDRHGFLVLYGFFGLLQLCAVLFSSLLF